MVDVEMRDRLLVVVKISLGPLENVLIIKNQGIPWIFTRIFIREKESINPSNKGLSAMASESSEMGGRGEEKKGITSEQIRELQAYLSKLNAKKGEESGGKVINHVLGT